MSTVVPPVPDPAPDRVIVTPPPVEAEPVPDVGARPEPTPPSSREDAPPPSTVSTPYGLAPVDVDAAPAALLAVSADGDRDIGASDSVTACSVRLRRPRSAIAPRSNVISSLLSIWSAK